MAKVTVNLKGFKELRERLRNASAKIRKEVNAELKVAAEDIAVRAKRDAPADQNAIRNGINVGQVSELKWEVFSNAAHSVYMEFGTKGKYQPIPGVDVSEFKAPGGRVKGGGFYDAILDWVKRKKISGSYSVKTRRRVGGKVEQQIEDEQTAFAIYLSIIRHGVKPHPFFFKQQDIVGPQLVKNVQRVLDDQRL